MHPVICLYCRRRIGLLRLFVDRNYCCDLHEQLMRKVSSRAARDHDLVPSEWESFRQRYMQRRQSGWEMILAAGMVAAILLGVSYTDKKAYGTNSTTTFSNKLQDWGEQLRTSRNRHQWDFQGGFSDWLPTGPSRESWKLESGTVRPAGLRIWESSRELSNYRFEFAGRIERKSLTWVYRASDGDNYHATKVVLAGKPGSMRADLVRWTVIDGAASTRTKLPLPVPLRAERTYRIRTEVKEDSFTTFINGQLVDHWTDDRLKRGGVGFVSEKGETSEILWAEVAAPESSVGRVLSHLGFFAPRR